MNLDNLERLLHAASYAPWSDTGPFVVDGDGERVCRADDDTWRIQADIDLCVAMRNALPALLRVARAAQTVVSVDAQTQGGEFWYAEEMERVIPYLAAALAALEGTYRP